jgi:hypothetical protein
MDWRRWRNVVAPDALTLVRVSSGGCSRKRADVLAVYRLPDDDVGVDLDGGSRLQGLSVHVLEAEVAHLVGAAAGAAGGGAVDLVLAASTKTVTARRQRADLRRIRIKVT